MARKGWNGKKQYIQLATGISYKTPDGEIVNCEHDAIGNMAIAFVGTSGVQMGWLASHFTYLPCLISLISFRFRFTPALLSCIYIPARWGTE